MVSFGIELSLCGFGYEGGLFPSLQMGIVMIWWCRGSMLARIRKLHIALAEAARELGR